MRAFISLGLLSFLIFSAVAHGDAQRAEELFMKAYHPVATPLSILSEDTFMNLYQVWPAGPYRRKALELAKSTTPSARQELKALIMERYGLPENPYLPGVPLAATVNPKSGNWVTTCTACHAGKVAGKVVFGRGNPEIDLYGYTEDLITYRAKYGSKDFEREGGFTKALIDRVSFGQLAKLFYKTERGTESLSWNRGQSEPWAFAEFGLMARRKASLGLGTVDAVKSVLDRFNSFTQRERATLDTPAWWTTGLKTRFYSDGFAPNTERTPMLTAIMSFEPGEWIRSQEADYKVLVDAFAELPVPRYEQYFPGRVDAQKAKAGHEVFANTCAKCHGDYEVQGGRTVVKNYETPIVESKEIGTDPLRLTTLDPWYPAALNVSWIGYLGEQPVRAAPYRTESTGYVAPPLVGVWATAPYFHNGAAPTLWDVLHPDSRAKVWRVVDSPTVQATREPWRVATYDSYDHEKMGFLVERLEAMPGSLSPQRPQTEDAVFYRRTYFDGSERVLLNGNVEPVHPGKSVRGHYAPDLLTEVEKDQVLEYLKTL